MDNFNYYKYLKIIEKYFDTKNIGIFFFEDFLLSSKNFQKSIFEFLKISYVDYSGQKIYSSKKIFGYYESKNNKYYFARKKILFDNLKYKNTPNFIKKILESIYPLVFSYPNFFFFSNYK